AMVDHPASMPRPAGRAARGRDTSHRGLRLESVSGSVLGLKVKLSWRRLSMSVTVERRGHVVLIGLDRAAKRNSFTTDMLAELAAAYGELERDPDAWVGVLVAH